MADVYPFRGIFYNPATIHNLSEVVTPPFDVISAEEQDDYYLRHPKNIIRLILGKRKETDSSSDNPHTRAAAYYRQWLAEGTLIQDDREAVYLTAVNFPLHGQIVTRFGFIALVRLEPFDRRIVLPHEKTFSKVRSERLDLMKACHANFSPIFSLFPGGGALIERLRENTAHQSPECEVTDIRGLEHKLWRVLDTSLHKEVTRTLKESRLFIADGHHRYETALAYRDWIAARTPVFSPSHPSNFVMMYLCSMEDPGLVILPAHRMLDRVPAEAASTLLQQAAPYFDVETFAFSPGQADSRKTEFLDRLHAGIDGNTIGVIAKDQPMLGLLRLKPGVMQSRYGSEITASLLSIDVTVLTRLILMDLLGFSNDRLDDASLIHYESSAESAIDAVARGRHDMAFLLNPTKIEQVKTVCEEGWIMPRKATYFYPKVLSGRVLNSLVP